MNHLKQQLLCLAMLASAVDAVLKALPLKLFLDHKALTQHVK